MATKREGEPAFEKAALDEPLFVLRAQDSIAPEVVEMWALTARMRGVARKKTDEARKLAQRMRDWQELHGSKLPD